MHFASREITRKNKNQYEWHCFPLKKDFFGLLRKYQQLPIDAPKEALVTIEALKREILILKRELEDHRRREDNKVEEGQASFDDRMNNQVDNSDDDLVAYDSDNGTRVYDCA